MEETGDIKDGHDLKALAHSCWGEDGVKRAKAALIGYNGRTDGGSGRFALRYFVNKVDREPRPEGTAPTLEADFKYGPFEAWTPYRMISYSGETPEQAVANMLHGIAKLAREGALNPDQPSDAGSPSIQHALNVLTERLAWQTARREEHVHDLSDKGGMAAGPDTKTTLMPGLDRNNQIIAALGTAIAALARVNDL